jgi:hypothetical protein
MASKTVKVSTPGEHGSGVFVAPDLVVTAAHVIQPAENDAPWPPRRLSVTLFDGTLLPVIARLCHKDWPGAEVTGDIAIVRVADPQDDLVVPFVSNAPAKRRAVTITGYREGPNVGRVSRIAGDAGLDFFESDDLAFHRGVSGAPVMAGPRAIGIATQSFDTPTKQATIGVPFLDTAEESNLAWLIDQCPTGD